MIDLEKELAGSYKILEQTQTGLTVELALPQKLSYFEGHFPQRPILPAVGILDITGYFLSKYLKVGSEIRKVVGCKIRQPMGPGDFVRISFKKDREWDAFWRTGPESSVSAVNLTLEFSKS